MVWLGGGAPATITRVLPSPGIGPSQLPAASRTAFTTAGAAHRRVTPWRSTRLRISVPSIFRSVTWVQPMAVVAHGIPHPLAWNIGSVWR